MQRRSFLKSLLAASIGAGLVKAVPAAFVPQAPLAELTPGATYKALTLADLNEITFRVLQKMKAENYYARNPLFDFFSF